MIRRPPRSTQSRSSAASDVYKRQVYGYIKVADLKKILKEKGEYKPPAVLFQYFGFNMIKIRKKPMIAAFDNDEAWVSLFDLYFRYTTPLTIRFPEFYEFPVKFYANTEGRTTENSGIWLGKAYLNHRSITPLKLKGNEKHVRIHTHFRESNTFNSVFRYSQAWGNYYETFIRK
eukprot:TRINITY_DN5164_c0_g2_i1.p1 TRINITY_DN5164_c0_g2~~TRINITY_DN5164_c0_g2_i1.p1  ORF type:complete len:174 (+),score=19.39 TRINITY_DN5164_c0_g2_i1:13-534(+)